MPSNPHDQRRRPRTPAEGEPEGGEPGRQGERPGPPGLRPSRGLFGVISVLIIVSLMFLVLSSVTGTAQSVTWEQFTTLMADDQIEPGSITIRDNAITAWRRGGPDGDRTAVIFRFHPERSDFYIKDVDALSRGKGSFRDQPTSVWTQLLLSVLPILIIILIIWFFIFRGLRTAAGSAGGVLGNFGKSRHRVLMKEKTGITFDDVAGVDEAKEELTEIVEFLKSPRKFMRLGGRIPRGVLLVGEPGVGKTLLAKAIAGEADVPFFSISGSDFVEMFVGVGASRVRDLFKQAKDSAPCIIFLDEIDAVGRRRGGGFTTGGHDEREQTLNAILVEMDGFNSSDGVIVIAATNRSDVLDPALTRPGRFDRQISVPLPDVKGRLEILRVHSRKVKLGPDVHLERLARATPMFSGADLAAIINEAAISAALHDKDFIEQEDLEEARDKVKFGRAKKSRVREVEENTLTAYHEAGHAVVRALLTDADPLHKVTIIPRGNTGGATFSLPEKDRMGYGVKWLKATLRAACGGRIAEERGTGDVSSGAAMDIAQVTQIARTMVVEWGMSERLGFVRYTGHDTRETILPDREYSEETARLIDEEVRRIVDEAYRDAEKLLVENWDKVVAVAEALLKYETLSADDVMKIMRGESLARPTVSDLLAAESRKPAPPRTPTRGQEPELPPGALPNPA